MRAFVTGASGFIGSHLIDHLLEKKWKVRVLLHESRIRREKEVDVVWGDITDLDTLEKALKNTDILFHGAAALGAKILDKEEFFRINAEGTEKILEASRKAGVKRVVHFSSAGVLGKVKNNETASEDYPLNPISTYDQSKLEGEKIAVRHSREGTNVVIVRPGWVYGPGDWRTFKLIKAINKRMFILVTKGKAWQTPVYIQDLIKGIILCAEKGKTGEIYNLAGDEVLNVREIVETIATAAGKKIPRFYLPLLPVKCAALVLEKSFLLFKKEAPLTPSKLSFFIYPKPLSIEKARKELGFSPQVDFREGMALTVSWYRKNNYL